MTSWVLPLLLLGSPLFATATGTSPPAANKLPEARTLLRAMATVDGLEARFVERKHLALLRAPLVSEGRLYFTRPGHLARLTDSPAKSAVRIGPTSLEMTDENGKQSFDLRSRPDIKMFVESFVHVVAGDYDALAKTYELSFTPQQAEKAWLLTLTPARKPLSHLIDRLEIRGHGYVVSTIEVFETRGDKTEITLSDVDPTRSFSKSERRRIFGL
jgi:hypothetical protein